jgi:signal transduction histidine kinase
VIDSESPILPDAPAEVMAVDATVEPARRLILFARIGMLALVAILSVAATDGGWILLWVALLAIAGIPAFVPPSAGLVRTHRVLMPLGRVAEVLVTCLAADSVIRNFGGVHSAFSTPGSAAGAMLPYLVVPPVAAAIARRRTELVALLALAAAALITLGAIDHRLTDPGYVSQCIEWLVLAGVAAGMALALQRAFAERAARPAPYAEATRLLTQLRTVARQLPGATLDPGGLAEHLLDSVRLVAHADRAAVLCASGGSRLVVLAQSGLERTDWETSLDSDAVIAEAWASQQPQTSARSQSRSQSRAGGGEVSALVIPLITGVRTVGLLTIEADGPNAYPPGLVDRLVALAAPAALRLEAALLFDEVRSLATNEERQRLAREIHDGVAQELVMVGYGIDNALAIIPEDATDARDELRTLRAEVTRVITELRLSLFELRSEVDRHGGLTAAISEYARTVASSAGLRVHMSLDESTARLPAAVEAELLRIAQEAITNARKHAGAENLWVTCVVDPPFAQVEVTDDGQGMGDTRPDGRYGLAIMAERAERIRGRLEFRPRHPTGTTVAIVIGTSSRRGGGTGSPSTAESEGTASPAGSASS